jgi:hypothetical protein
MLSAMAMSQKTMPVLWSRPNRAPSRAWPVKLTKKSRDVATCAATAWPCSMPMPPCDR